MSWVDRVRSHSEGGIYRWIRTMEVTFGASFGAQSLSQMVIGEKEVSASPPSMPAVRPGVYLQRFCNPFHYKTFSKRVVKTVKRILWLSTTPW